MKIPVQFYAQLRDIVGVSSLEVDVPQGATVAQLIDKICELKPALRTYYKSILVGAGVNFVERDHVIGDGEELAIMPPVQGG
jgi:molybdopterin converting factor small subunit